MAKSLNLDLDHKQTTKGAGGQITGALIKHNRVDIDGLTMDSNIKVYATSLDHLEISIGRNVDGIIGYDILDNHGVRINYDSKQFEIYNPGESPKIGKAIGFKLHNAIPVIEATVTLNNGETLKSEYYVNTGAGTTLDFNTPYANANGIIDKTGDHYSYLVKGIEQQESKHYEGRVQTISFGDFTMNELPIGISQAQYGLQNDKKIAGIIGNRLLSRFNLSLDYKNKMIYFEPNAAFENGFTVNASGIDIQLNKDKSKVLIHQVYAGSPAEKAGIQVNDILVKVNGTAAMDMGLVEVEKILKMTGKEVELVINSGGEEKTVKITLKELI